MDKIKKLEVPKGLLNKIILAIKQEQELKKSKKLAIFFFCLLIISVFLTPFSWKLFSSQILESGMLHFIYIAISDMGSFFALKQEFILAIAESLPVTALIFFLVNIIMAVFTIRLFLTNKAMLIKYLIRTH